MDWDNDGDLDLIVGEYLGRIHLYLNVGTAQNPDLTHAGFVQMGSSNLDVGGYSMPFTCDWDNDGLFDLLIGEHQGRVSLYLNDGTASAPHFSARNYVMDGGSNLDVGFMSAVTWTDLDNDTLPDLVLGNDEGALYFFKNQGAPGAPVFSGSEHLTVGGDPIDLVCYSRPFPVDWDNDGDVDIVTGHYLSVPILYRNDPAPVALPGFSLIYTGPEQIPSSGATVSYRVAVQNNEAYPITIDLFSYCRVLGSGLLPFWYGPILNYQSVTLQPGQLGTRTFSLPIPGYAPQGWYDYTVHVSDSPGWVLTRFDSFHIFKN